MSFAGFTSGADLQDTDQLVGYRTAAPGGERRWTIALLKAAIESEASGITFVSFPANSAAAGEMGQVSYDNGVFAVYIGQAESGGPNWVFLGAFERA